MTFTNILIYGTAGLFWLITLGTVLSALAQRQYKNFVEFLADVFSWTLVVGVLVALCIGLGYFWLTVFPIRG